LTQGLRDFGFNRKNYNIFLCQAGKINFELVNAANSLAGVTHFFLGLTNEWLETISGSAAGAPVNMPVCVNGKTERLALSK
jgi:hypothetical protein